MTEMVRTILRAFGISGEFVIALIGKPGTGKSYHAQRIASELDAELIVDDGLLIQGGTIVCGRSAKNEHTVIAATKTAIFLDEEHCSQAKACITNHAFKRILVLGTSLRMVVRIARQLDLGKIGKIIRIEEVLSTDQIQLARNHRKKMGQHIIPVPAMEIEKWYPSIFFKSVQTVIARYRNKNTPQKINYENSIVRPRFAHNFRISISKNAIHQMIASIVTGESSEIVISSVKIKWTRSEACRIYLHVQVHTIENMSAVMLTISEKVKFQIESNIGIVVETVAITIVAFDNDADKVSQSHHHHRESHQS